MKQFLLAIIFILSVNVTQAQSVWHFYLDYSAANFDDSLTLWQLRSVNNPTDTTDVNFAAVAVTGPLAGYYDPTDIINSVNEWSYFNNPITFDSLFANIWHKNHSGLNDTIVFQLVTLANNGTPTNTIIYSDTIFTNQSLSDSSEVIRIHCTPGFTTTQGQGIAITLKYYGAVEDTLKLQAGYLKDNSGNVYPQLTQYKNSYIRISPNYNSIVKNTTITNYNGTPIKAQNWKFSASVDYGFDHEWPWDTTSVKEYSILENIVISPNPTQNTLTINLAKALIDNINIQVLNPLGQVVKTQAFDKSAGQKLILDIAELPIGLYFVKVQVADAVKTLRLVKQ